MTPQKGVRTKMLLAEVLKLQHNRRETTRR
jgi:hypothetical protein